jgi:hypothetical protein
MSSLLSITTGIVVESEVMSSNEFITTHYYEDI